MAAKPDADAEGALVVMFPSPLVTWLHASYGYEDGDRPEEWLALDDATQDEGIRAAVRIGLAREVVQPNTDPSSDEEFESLFELTDRGECAAAVLFDIFGE